MSTKFRIYQKLMPNRIKEILIISSPYDAFIMKEDGGLLEHVFTRYRGIGLISPPIFTVVSDVTEADKALNMKNFDLVVIMPRTPGVEIESFGKNIKSKFKNLPVILLAQHVRMLGCFPKTISTDAIDKIFIWSGNRTILWTIIKWLEDRMNVEHDTKLAMVRVLILIEDSPHHYSSILPMLYREIVRQTQSILEDSLNAEHHLLKLRARTKILLANNFEEGMELYKKFRPYILGIFTDTRYPKGNIIDPEAGLKFLKYVKDDYPHLPILLLSTEKTNQKKANKINAFFQDKNSPLLHKKMGEFLKEHMGFGDFAFKMPNGKKIAKASNLRELEKSLKTIPDESLTYHVALNHFSNWLMARSEVNLSLKFRIQKHSDFSDIKEIRRFLLAGMNEARIAKQKGIVSSFNPEKFNPETTFLRMGDGSLGGKARGLAFMAKFLQEKSHLLESFNNITISIPKTLVIATDYFDDFLNTNNLYNSYNAELSDNEIISRFKKAKLPKELEENLKIFLEQINHPLAIRSSSLLEDSKDCPYAGLYTTYMIPNNHNDFDERLKQLTICIRLVYASIFFEGPRAFSKATGTRIEDEKMAVLIQQITGSQYVDYFYPAISGTAQSHNFYPVAHMQPEDGVAHISLGLGKIVVEGGETLRFSPKYPQNLAQFSNVKEILNNSQKTFFALKMKSEIKDSWKDENISLERREISSAVNEMPVQMLASSYIQNEQRIRDSFSSEHYPVMTFARILKYNQIPLGKVISTLLEIGKEGFGSDIELEFAVNLSENSEHKSNFILLQTRPMTTHYDDIEIDISDTDVKEAICYSTNSLGRGETRDIRNIIMVKPEAFATKSNVAIAMEISKINKKLEKENEKYLLIGPGRWGSSDHSLGIPVTWKDISGVSGIIEASTESFRVDPSQGTHFFQNITSLGITYMTITQQDDFINWEWFKKQEVIEETNFVFLSRTKKPFLIKIDSRRNQGILRE